MIVTGIGSKGICIRGVCLLQERTPSISEGCGSSLGFLLKRIDSKINISSFLLILICFIKLRLLRVFYLLRRSIAWKNVKVLI